MPDENKNDQNIHIDTFYLQSYLMGREESEREATKQVKEAIRRAKNNGDISIKFSFLVIAELINNVKLQERNIEKRKEIFQDLFKVRHGFQ